MISIDHVQRVVAEYHNMSVEDLRRHDQSWTYSRPRQLAMYLARNITKSSYPELGAAFNRDHTTVISGVSRIGRLVREDPPVADLVIKLRRSIEGIPAPLELMR
jgi:chromosomal replication initiator protein